MEEGTRDRQIGGWTNDVHMGFHMFFCVHVHTYAQPILRNYNSSRLNSLETILEEAHTHTFICFLMRSRGKKERNRERGRISSYTVVWLCAVEGA